MVELMVMLVVLNEQVLVSELEQEQGVLVELTQAVLVAVFLEDHQRKAKQPCRLGRAIKRKKIKYLGRTQSFLIEAQ